MSLSSTDSLEGFKKTAKVGAPQRFPEILRNAPVGIIITDSNSKCIFVNDKWCSLTGLSQDDANSCWENSIHYDDREYLLSKWGKVLNSGETIAIEFRLNSPEKNQKRLLINAGPYDNSDSSNPLFIGYFTETSGIITNEGFDLKSRRQQSRIDKSAAKISNKNEMQHRILLQSILSPVIALDKELSVQYCNNAFAELINTPIEEIESRKLVDLSSDFKESSLFKTFKRILKDGECLQDQSRFGTVYLNSRVYPTPWGILSISDDVTDQKLAQDAVHNAHIELETRVKERTSELITINKSLSKEINDRKSTQKALIESEECFRNILQNMPVMMDAFDKDTRIIIWNRECQRITGYSEEEVINQPDILNLLYPDKEYREKMIAEWHNRDNDYRNWEWDITCKDGSIKTIAWSNISGLFPVSQWECWEIGFDVTELRQAERELLIINEKMLLEEKALKEKNIALKEILNQIENEKRIISVQIQSNVEKIVLPLLRKLEVKVGEVEKVYITLLEDSLDNITAPFVRKLGQSYSRLTPREIEICNMIKSGLTSKEIASTLNTSVNTINNHRQNIRKKLEISLNKTNLCSYLQTI
ncbi:MAG: PAS domain S-box protein [candidate division Zixibacteria bacterium]|nr:PAS domain S-box protein [candidate division Zixibacteria bacterium]